MAKFLYEIADKLKNKDMESQWDFFQDEKKVQQAVTAIPEEILKEEQEIVRWMRNNVPVKRTKLLNHTVEYFISGAAIDMLSNSPWAEPLKFGEDPLFTSRESVVEYLDILLQHNFFHRARKIAVPKTELKKMKNRKPGKFVNGMLSATNSKKTKDDHVPCIYSSSASEEIDDDDKVEETSQEDVKLKGGKKKRKIKLDMHRLQRFVDGSDAYVWIYEKTPFHHYLYSLLVVVTVILLCLFPLWPSSLKDTVYLMAYAAGAVIAVVIALFVIRQVVFVSIWGLTFGQHHLWIFPNLTEDVGFFASFWPLYQYEDKGPWRTLYECVYGSANDFTDNMVSSGRLEN